MKVGIFTDLRFTSIQNPTGVTKHINNMVEGLYYKREFNLVLLVAKDQVDDCGNVPKSNHLSFLDTRVLPYTWFQIQFLGLLFGLPYFDKYVTDLDLVYCPKNDFLPLKKSIYLATFHGAHELDPDFPRSKGFKNKYLEIKSNLNYKRIVKQAKVILTVSEFLRIKSKEQFFCDLSKIKVVGNGVEDEFFNIGKRHKYNQNGHFVAVGGLNLLDGGDRLIKIAKYLIKTNSSREIWIAGDQHEQELLEMARGLNNVKLLGYVKKEELAIVMERSSALLFFTKYETFGIAAVEAMAIGIPVFTLWSTAVPEIVGPAGIYFDNNETSLEDVLNNTGFIKEKILLGKIRANDFLWDNCVDRLAKFIQDSAHL